MQDVIWRELELRLTWDQDNEEQKEKSEAFLHQGHDRYAQTGREREWKERWWGFPSKELVRFIERMEDTEWSECTYVSKKDDSKSEHTQSTELLSSRAT